MRCCQRSIWLYRSIYLQEFPPPAYPGCPGPPLNPPFQLQDWQKCTFTYIQLALYCIWDWIDRYLTVNLPSTSFVRSSLNWAFAVSKSKSDSNCKVVAFEFFTSSWPLLLFLDLRLPAPEKVQTNTAVKLVQSFRTGSCGLGCLLL